MHTPELYQPTPHSAGPIRHFSPGTDDHRSELQGEMQRLLSAYINGGCLTAADRILSLASPALPFKKNAPRIVDAYNAFANSAQRCGRPTWRIGVESYKGCNIHVRRMADYLRTLFSDASIRAYVHGSLGTYEEIPYSDFDALVLLSDSLLRDPGKLSNAAQRLSRARSFMFEMDPLQHHGWFVLTEADFHHYCDAYFPRELFRRAKSLSSTNPEMLQGVARDSTEESRRIFFEVGGALRRSLASRQLVCNCYHLKNALSLFMLLPSLYLQVRDGHGVYKKFSFELARSDFTAAEWRCMDQVSEIRMSWGYAISTWRKELITGVHTMRRRAARWWAPVVPEDIKSRVTPDLVRQMDNLVTRMSQKLRTT